MPGLDLPGELYTELRWHDPGHVLLLQPSYVK